MNRRSFLGILGLAPLALMVAPLPLLIKNEGVPIPLEPFNFAEGRFYPRPWQPNTAYNIGDRVQFSNGQIVELQMSGTSASVEMINGTIVPLMGRI